MQHLQGLLFALILAGGYALFFRHQESNATQPLAVSRQTVAPQADPYKTAMDRAHAAVGRMEASHRESDAFGAILSSR